MWIFLFLFVILIVYYIGINKPTPLTELKSLSTRKDDIAIPPSHETRISTAKSEPLLHQNLVKEEAQIKCPSCHSTQLTANKKGFGLGKAAAGGLLLGPVGLLGGVIGSSGIKITCLRCGNVFMPGSGH